MALQIEQQTRDIGVVRTTLGPERTRVIVRPGDAFRFIDDAGQPIVRAPRLRVRRLDNNLIIDGLPDGREVELNNFFGACRPGAECTVSLAGIGLPGAAVITEDSPPTAALQDGSFLLYSDNTDSVALAALPAAKVVDAAGPSWLAIGGAAAGIGIAAAAAGGGGGGGGPAEDTTAPGAPVVTSGAVLRRASALVTGEAEAGARVTVRVDVNGNGTFTDPGDVAFVTTAGADGRWSVDLNQAPQSGTLPPGGLVDGQAYALLVQAADASQNASPSTRTTVTLDGTAPAAPVLAVVAGDDVVNGAERQGGVTVAGTAEAGASVAVTWGATTLTATAGANGQFSVPFQPTQVPADGNVAIRAVATDAAGNESAPGSRPGAIAIDTVAPTAPTITSAAVTNLARPVLSGNAEAGSRVVVSLDLASNGGVDVTYATTASPTGVWSVDTATATPTSGSIGAGLPDRSGATLTANALSVVATDPAGNASPAASGTVTRDSTIPPAPAIAAVAGDDIVNAVERPGSVTVSGTLDPAYSGRPVTVTWGATVRAATVTGTAWSAVFVTTEIPAGEGATTVQATTVSLAGVISATGTRTVTIDTTPPAAPTASLTPGSDTGTPGDNITTATTPTIRVDLNGIGGAAPVAGDTVRLTSAGGVLRGSAVLTGADILADFVNVTTSALPVGATTLSATVTDVGGNASGAGTLALTILAAPSAPTVAPDLLASSDSGASSTDNITSDTTPTFVIGALPAGVTAVRLFVAGVEVTTSAYDPAGGGQITPSTPLAAPGVAQAITYAYVDGTGAVTAQSPALPVTIDTTAPAPPSSAPDLLASSDTGASNTDNITDDLTPTFVVGALPAGVTGMQLLVNGEPVAATYVSTGGGQITPDAPLAPSATVRAFGVALFDAAGNVGAQGPTLSVVVDTDTTPPAAPTVAPDLLASSDSGVSNTDNITNAARPVFSIGALPVGVAGARLYVGGAQVAATYDAVAGTLTPSADVPAPGPAQAVTYTYLDAFGNESTASPGLSVTLDRTAPTAGSVTFTFNVFDDRGTVATGDDIAFVDNTVVTGSTDTTPRVVLTVNTLLANDRLQLVRDITPLGVLTAAGVIDLNEAAPLPTAGAAPSTPSALYSVSLTDLAGNAPTVLDLNGGALGTDFVLRISVT